MAGGMYAALSGMSVKLQDIDRVATDLANIGTSGYKTEQQAVSAVERGQFRRDLDSAIDVMSGDRKLDMRPGLIASTGRDLDVALEGNGFFVVQTPQGDRYTRDGGFLRRGDGVLAARDGNPVMGQDGEIQIGADPCTCLVVDTRIETEVRMSTSMQSARSTGWRIKATRESASWAPASAPASRC